MTIFDVSCWIKKCLKYAALEAGVDPKFSATESKGVIWPVESFEITLDGRVFEVRIKETNA